MTTLGIADQVRLAFQVTTRTPAIVGAVFGGIVPPLAFVFSHFGPPVATLKGTVCAAFVVLCLGYSIPKVVKWGHSVFSGKGALLEAWSFALIMEGAMVLAGYLGSHWSFTVAGCVCLAILVAVNALSTACSAALGQRAVNEARRAAREERNPDTLSLDPTSVLQVVRPNPGEWASMKTRPAAKMKAQARTPKAAPRRRTAGVKR
jgi:hypothetical protein